MNWVEDSVANGEITYYKCKVWKYESIYDLDTEPFILPHIQTISDPSPVAFRNSVAKEEIAHNEQFLITILLLIESFICLLDVFKIVWLYVKKIDYKMTANVKRGDR